MENLELKSTLINNCTPDDLGREVRRVWVECARELPDPKPHHLLEYDDLDEWNQEVDRRIGEAVAKLVITNLSEEGEI